MSTVKDVLKILEREGFTHALCALGEVEGIDREWQLLAVAYARRIHHLMTDPESITALDVAERNAEQDAAELAAARKHYRSSEAKWAARVAAALIRRKTGSCNREWAAEAAAAVRAAARAAAEEAANAAASAAAEEAANAAAAMASVADADARDDAFWAERDWQIAELRRVCECIEAGTDPYPRGEA